jgi:DNA-binding transcriptional LysR family regulator
MGCIEPVHRGPPVAPVAHVRRDPLLADGRLVQVLPEWAEETYPLYAYHHSAQLMSAKVRAFLDFVVALTREPFPGAGAARP